MTNTVHLNSGLPHHNTREDSHVTVSSVELSIFKGHLSDMLDLISDPDTERLANDLSAVDLIPFSVLDNIMTTNLSRYQKASKLLHQIHRSLEARHSNKSEILVKFCDILNRQHSQDLTRIAQDILNELGMVNALRSPLINMEALANEIADHCKCSSNLNICTKTGIYYIYIYRPFQVELLVSHLCMVMIMIMS